jgi:glucan phosphoethanolaminetransferase (alkaline phosphatase superfamily)
MAKITKETISTQETNEPVAVNTQSRRQATNSQTTEYLIYFFVGLLDVLLAFRLVLKLMGASLSSVFVRAIYAITGLFIMPFEGIFRRGFTQGIETTSVLEPATLVAFIVYALLAWGIVKLVRVFSGEEQTE